MTARLPEIETLRVGVIGLGYVGLPLAIALAREWTVVGFDVDVTRLAELDRGHDRTDEVTPEQLAGVDVQLSADSSTLGGCDVLIVAVPTPVDDDNYPDLQPLLTATRLVASELRPGNVVIYESTVYPGATEELCAPLLAEGSGLSLNEDFWVGYSPERINPGDTTHGLENIVKVTSGSTPEAAAFVDRIYRRIVTAGTHMAPSIRVAEAAKAVENTQRDINIAFVNELAMMFRRMGIDTRAVLEAAATKWNFLPFKPGLVGGHCIGVDPYYLIHKAQEAGFYPELILASRRINDGMASYVVGRFLGLLARNAINVVGARVLILGLAFKENCADLRNTQVASIVSELAQVNAKVDVHDPVVSPEEAAQELGIELIAEPSAHAYDAILLAVAHDAFADHERVRSWLTPGGVIYDVKSALPAHLVAEQL